MVNIKVNYENGSFNIDSDLVGDENRLIFAELVAGVTVALNDLSQKMGLPKDLLSDTFTGALKESLSKE